MLPQIKNLNDVQLFAKALVAEGLNFHPDEDFFNYVNTKTGVPAYSAEEAGLRNRLMDQCFDVCHKEGVDIYDTMLEVVLLETGMNQLIPLPSSVN